MSTATRTSRASAVGARALGVAALLALAARAGGVAAAAGPSAPSVPLTAIIWRPTAEESPGATKGGFHLLQGLGHGPLHGGHGQKRPLRRNLQCECSNPGACGCCAPIEVPQLGFSETVCLNLTFHPQDLTATVNVLLNGNSVLETTLSGNNPPPLCVPIPQFPLLSVCVRLYDLGVSASGLRACVNLELQLQGVPLLVARFDCVRVGAGGVSVEPRPPLTALAAAAPGAATPRPGDVDFHDPVDGLGGKQRGARRRGRLGGGAEIFAV